MVSSKMLHRLATNPHDHMRFLTTGRLPHSVRPSSPLITLLKAISPHDRARLVGMRVDSRLGYTGSRQFHYGGQVLNWVCPSDEVFGAFPADSWRDKRFTRSARKAPSFRAVMHSAAANGRHVFKWLICYTR